MDCKIWFKSDLNQVSAKLDIAAWLTSVKNIHPDKNDVHLELYGSSPSIYFLGRVKFYSLLPQRNILMPTCMFILTYKLYLGWLTAKAGRGRMLDI